MFWEKPSLMSPALVQTVLGEHVSKRLGRSLAQSTILPKPLLTRNITCLAHLASQSLHHLLSLLHPLPDKCLGKPVGVIVQYFPGHV